MLELKNLTYERGKMAFNVDLSVEPGRVVALLGPSGVGKSTLVQVVAGFLSVKTGRVRLGNVDMTELTPAKRPIAVLQQDHNLFTHLNLRDNIALGLSGNLRLSQDDWLRVAEMAEKMGLIACLDDLPRALSGGQKARGALARVLLQAPDLVMMDEPFAALGPAQRLDIQDLIDHHMRDDRRILLVVAHQVDDLREWVDEVIWMGSRHEVSIHKAGRFFDNPPPSARAYLGQ